MRWPSTRRSSASASTPPGSSPTSLADCFHRRHVSTGALMEAPRIPNVDVSTPAICASAEGAPDRGHCARKSGGPLLSAEDDADQGLRVPRHPMRVDQRRRHIGQTGSGRLMATRANLKRRLPPTPYRTCSPEERGGAPRAAPGDAPVPPPSPAPPPIAPRPPGFSRRNWRTAARGPPT